MSKGMRFMESPATSEEDSYDYRVEWDDHVLYFKNGEHLGAGSEYFTGLDNAWDRFCDYKETMSYKGLRLIQIDSNGFERLYTKG